MYIEKLYAYLQGILKHFVFNFKTFECMDKDNSTP